tara:strand:- start:291 stop:506 length:216 start_codon:yes stop_codon:yes gene_type:complete
MHDKLITGLLAILIALSGWSLSTTVGLKSDVAVLNEKVSKLEKDVEEIGWNTFDSNKKKKKKKKKKKLNVQ